MQNIDRTNLESNYGAFSGEYETADGYEFESDQEFETYGPFSEAEEIEMVVQSETTRSRLLVRGSSV